jgi:FlaA1/EpsC-like NDP-sugar epimerase
MKRVVIIGASGHAKVLIDTIEQTGTLAIAGFVSPDGRETRQCWRLGTIGGESSRWTKRATAALS